MMYFSEVNDISYTMNILQYLNYINIYNPAYFLSFEMISSIPLSSIYHFSPIWSDIQILVCVFVRPLVRSSEWQQPAWHGTDWSEQLSYHFELN